MELSIMMGCIIIVGSIFDLGNAQNLSNSSATTPLQSTSLPRRRLAIAIAAVLIGLLVASAFAIWLTSRILQARFRKKMESISRRNSDVMAGIVPFQDATATFSVQDLTLATDHFSAANVIGRGSCATVYKALLSDGRMVVIKRYDVAREGNCSLEYEILSVAKHKHIVELLGYSSADSMVGRLLVFEAMGNGSLSQHLHESNGGAVLQWETRLKIAMHICHALCFLHVYSEPCIVHGNLTSDNVLLDSEWNAKLGGFSRAVYSISSDGISYTTPMMSVATKAVAGYEDPDIGGGHEIVNVSGCERAPAVKASDVYRLGVVMLEMLSGRRARDMRYQPPDLASWAAPPAVQAGYAYDALIDPRLPVPLHVESALKKTMEMAFWCVTPKKGERPTMVDVLRGLQQVLHPLISHHHHVHIAISS